MKKYICHGHELDKQHLIKELGDVAWYLAEAAHALGVPLEEVLAANIEKLKRRYPDGFSTEKSIDKYLCDTISAVFQTVYVADRGTNRIVFASNNPEIVNRFQKNYPKNGHALTPILSSLAANLTPYEGGDLILTDDKAPVELLGMQVIDEMIMNELNYYKKLFKGMSIQEILDNLQ